MNRADVPKQRKSPIVKRSIVIGGHKSSISLEDEFWAALKEIAKERGRTLNELVTEIDQSRAASNLSSAIRTFVLLYFQAKTADLKKRVAGLQPEP